jgi:hypothetical protein
MSRTVGKLSIQLVCCYHLQLRPAGQNLFSELIYSHNYIKRNWFYEIAGFLYGLTDTIIGLWIPKSWLLWVSLSWNRKWRCQWRSNFTNYLLFVPSLVFEVTFLDNSKWQVTYFLSV